MKYMNANELIKEIKLFCNQKADLLVCKNINDISRVDMMVMV
jgi:hypothetical protein